MIKQRQYARIFLRARRRWPRWRGRELTRARTYLEMITKMFWTTKWKIL